MHNQPLRLLYPYLIIFLAATCILGTDYNDDHGFSPDKTGWIDPNDPSSRRQNIDVRISKLLEENERLKARIAELGSPHGAVVPVKPTTQENSCDRSDSELGKTEIVIFKHLVRKLQQKFVASGSYVADIRISQELLGKWNEFLSSTTLDTKNLQTLADTISDLFLRVKKDSVSSISEPTVTDQIIDLVRSYLPILNFCLLIPAVAILLLQLVRISRWQLAMWILFFIFFISVVWTWIHLYKERQAEMQARFARYGSGAESCKRKENVSAWSAMKEYVGSWFRFKINDPCVEYFKDVMIDPVWTVSPLEAVSVAVTKFFVRPLEPLGHAMARFWTVFLGGIPLPAYFIVLPAMGALLVFLILVTCGYRLRLGFGLLSLEPREHRRVDRLNGNDQFAVQSRMEGREISTQTAPSVTWTAGNDGQRVDSGQGEEHGHVRRPSGPN